jgi:hypothetical protein
VAYAGWVLYTSYQQSVRFGDAGTKSPLYGIWNVDELTTDGKSRPPLATDTSRWRRVVFDYPTMIAFQLMDDTRQRYGLKLDAAKHQLELTKFDDKTWKSVLTYKETAPGLLTIEGTFDGRPVRCKLRRVDEKTFLLTSRGFHWINEYPFNR